MRAPALIQADIDAVRAAKLRLLTGKAVEEFRLHGREFRMSRITYADLAKEEAALIDELNAADGVGGILIATFPGDPGR